MPTYSEIAYAKINLALHVRKRRADGYHELETLFAFGDVGDKLTAAEANALSLNISGRFGGDLSSDDNNLVLRAAHLLRDHFGIRAGATLSLDKNLPVASGIGGGSADAAATARLLNRLWNLDASDTELAELLAPLGADIPACVASTPAIGRGTGTELQAIDAIGLTGMPVLLVNPLKPVPTGEVFSIWDGIDRGGLVNSNVLAAAMEGRNDLQLPAIAICPEIDNILARLRETNPSLTRMSGSGATCFALYETAQARDTAQAAMADHWWTLTGSLR
ncbi:MAG: 4-(cytidine 5'-diphospho)-2-C-methyl-D-erythritol kinase [Sphingorhabdus sp.]